MLSRTTIITRMATRPVRLRNLVFSRALSSAAATPKKVAIHFGSTTGTAQLFAQELQMALQERYGDDDAVTTSVDSLADTSNVRELDPQALHLFLVSTAGVGEPPAAAQTFFESLQQHDDYSSSSSSTPLRFGVFGLGNSAAHPHHYNVAGQTLHQQLVEKAQAQPWLPLALGDDGDCIEEDYDQWQADVLQKLAAEEKQQGQPVSSVEEDADNTSAQQHQPSATPNETAASSATALASPPFGKRLQLVATEADTHETTRTDLADVLPTGVFYHADTQRWKVQKHVSLSPQPTANGLHELQLSLTGPMSLSYDAGDHLVVYPSQPDYLVEAYLDHFDISIDRAVHSTVQPVDDETSSYPHPTGISLYDTLRYCVDVLSPPSPKLARLLLGRDDVDYKAEVFTPRLSPLALLKQSGNTDVTLEDLLCQLPSTAPRYYSIASSSVRHPNSLYLTYRPVRFFNSLGMPQQGLCTSYFQQLQTGNTLMAYVNRNPTFRLPTDPEAPVILLAGGCGVAAVRALVEELQVRKANHKTKTPVYIFLGFRNPADAAYLDVMESVNPDVLDVSYSLSCTEKDKKCALVSDRLHAHGATLYDLLQHRGAYLYACGGARTFGAAIQRELYNLMERHGQCSHAQAKEAVQELVRQGRYCDDLSD